MALFPEKEPKLPVSEVPESPEIPEHLEKAGVATTPTTFGAKITDDSGKPLIQTSQTEPVTIQLPADQTTLVTYAKGQISDSVTWLAAFWLRLVKKAFHFGWTIMGGKNAAGS